MGALSAMKFSKALRNTAAEHSVEMAKSLSNMVQLVLLEELKVVSQLALKDSVVNAARSASGRDSIDKGEMEKVRQDLLKAMKKAGSDYLAFYITDSKGMLIADSIGGKYKANVADRDYFKEARKGRPAIGDSVKSKGGGMPILPLCAPILSSSGEFLGILGAVLKSDFLVEKIQAVKLGRTGYAFIMNRTGLLVSHPNKDYLLEMNVSTQKGMQDLAKKMMAGQTGFDTCYFQGTKKFVAFAPLETMGWSIAISQNDDELMAPANEIRHWIILIGLVSLVLTFLVVLRFSQFLSKPIISAVAEINSAVNQFNDAVQQVSTSSQSLAQRAARSAASLEEVASSFAGISTMICRNTNNIGQSNKLLDDAGHRISRSNASMEELTKTMKGISDAGEKTSKIVKTINEISSQTHLLAVNAAVEAARAGEAGASFAIVADEVRNLAVGATEAAKSTTDLIEDIVDKIHEGSSLVAKTGVDFSDTMEKTEKIRTLIEEITAASRQQSDGISQIDRAVQELNAMVQENAAAAQESASTAEEMNVQTKQIRDNVGNLAKAVFGDDNRLG